MPTKIKPIVDRETLELAIADLLPCVTSVSIELNSVVLTLPDGSRLTLTGAEDSYGRESFHVEHIDDGLIMWGRVD